MNIEFNLKKKSDTETTEDKNYDTEIKQVSAKKLKSHFKRGNLVLCLVFSPDNSRGELKNLLMEENILTDKLESLKFLVVERPALELSYKNKTYPVYICDAQKGVTVGINFKREPDLASVYCDPHMLSNVFDISFLSKASNIKPDWKQLVGIGLFGFIFGGLVGLMF